MANRSHRPKKRAAAVVEENDTASTFDVSRETLAAAVSDRYVPPPAIVAFIVLPTLILVLLGHWGWGLAAATSLSIRYPVFAMRRHRITTVLADPTFPVDPGWHELTMEAGVHSTIIMIPCVGALFTSWQWPEAINVVLGACTLLIPAMQEGTYSRKLLIASVGPPLLALIPAIGYFAINSQSGLAVGCFMTILLSFGTGDRGLRARFASFATQRHRADLIGELRTARDHAVAERAEAEAAREDARRADTVKSDFLASMSHELRTPMNGVLGMAQALRGTTLDQAQARYVSLLIKSGDNLMTILNDILDLSKIEAGRLDLNRAPFDLKQVALDTCEVWREIASEKQISLIADIAPDLPSQVIGDALRVRQILLNLISNAVKFTTQGSITLSVRAEADSVTLAVADTGQGITLENQERLFSPFTQVGAGKNRRRDGTGLGLSICRRLAELMNGEIRLKSEFGKGSTFTATLPLKAAAIAVIPPAKRRTADLAGVRLLLVDDNMINQIVGQAVLKSSGLVISTRSSGQEALDALSSETFDIVLMDIHMPGMDGIEATERIRRGEAGRADIPIIAFTADVMAGERDRLLSFGFDDLQPKPIVLDTIFDCITAALAAKSHGGGYAREPAALAS